MSSVEGARIKRQQNAFLAGVLVGEQIEAERFAQFGKIKFFFYKLFTVKSVILFIDLLQNVKKSSWRF